MLKQFIIIFFSFLLSIGSNESLATLNTDVHQPFHFITLSDIHFDPFIACKNATPCPLIQTLRNAPSSAWPNLLNKYDTAFPRYQQDSNYQLLKSALSAASKVSQREQAQFVIVLGDFLGHDYRNLYKKYSGDRSRQGYQSFVKKTMNFLTHELALAFPTIDVYCVVGNNDSYSYDYYSSPKGEFFSDTAIMWSGLVKNQTNRIGMQRIFPIAGYYAIDIPHQSNLRLIVLNSVLFSSKAKGKNVTQAAIEQLNWLYQQLALAKSKQQKVFIAMHIPAGVDIYATLQFRLFRLIDLWNLDYTKQFERYLNQYSNELAGIFTGHLHSDWFQILTLSNENRIPVAGTPSISPVFGNKPGFKVYTYSPNSQQVVDFQTYYYPMDPSKSWRIDYSFNKIDQSTVVVVNSQ